MSRKTPNEVPYKDKEAPPRCERKPLAPSAPIIAQDAENEMPPYKKAGTQFPVSVISSPRLKSFPFHAYSSILYPAFFSASVISSIVVPFFTISGM